MLPTGMRILVCTAPQDMRRSFDGLALVARELLGEEPQSGALYVFVSKSMRRLALLLRLHERVGDERSLITSEERVDRRSSGGRRRWWWCA